MLTNKLNSNEVLGITDYTVSSQSISLYLNPINDVLTLSGLQKENKIIISNKLGQKIKELDTSSSKINISIKELNQGIYIVSIKDQNNKNISSHKIVKK